jgi:glucose-1-phosphate thymidylyltransferase
MSDVKEAILLAGGLGTRLYPFTCYTSKHLLPVFDSPMIFYPLKNLQLMGVKLVHLIVNEQHLPQWNKLLSAFDFEMEIKPLVQESPMGIPAAISLCRSIIKSEKFIVALGDNLIIASDFINKFIESMKNPMNHAVIVGFNVADPRPFGVAQFAEGSLINIVEKPKVPPSNLAIVGLYMFSQSCFEKIDELKISDRGELEVADLINKYIFEDRCALVEASTNANDYWLDTGTIESIYTASDFLRHLTNTTGKRLAKFKLL